MAKRAPKLTEVQAEALKAICKRGTITSSWGRGWGQRYAESAEIPPTRRLGKPTFIKGATLRSLAAKGLIEIVPDSEFYHRTSRGPVRGQQASDDIVYGRTWRCARRR